MTSLPPKPESPPREREERRYQDDRDRRPARPMVSSRHLGDRISDSYHPRPQRQPEYDTYIAPAYSRRRDDDPRRGEFDSPYGRDRDRERLRDRERDRDRDRPWERDHRDMRDRDGRTRESGAHRPPYDRDRPFDKRRGDEPLYDRHREADYRRPSPPPRRYDSYRGPSRSPPRRRPISPPYRGRPRSRTRSRSPRPPSHPPSKRIKLGNHSISTTPRSPRSLSRSPPPHFTHRLPTADRDLPSGDIEASSSSAPPALSVTVHTPPQPSAPVQDEVKGSLDKSEDPNLKPNASPVQPPGDSDIARPKRGNKSRSSTPTAVKVETSEQTVTRHVSSPKHPEQIKGEDTKAEHSDIPIEKTSDQKSIVRERSVSPPKQPRTMSNNLARGSTVRRRMSRSPPRGPRNHPRNQQAFSASGPQYPTGPRGARRTYPSIGTSPTLLVGEASSAEIPRVSTPALYGEIKIPLPTIPPYQKRESITAALDLEIARLESYRTNHTLEYEQTAKSTRRALHELDMTTIDLRAAEGRRKIADVQLEKAKAGVLGVDALPSDVVQ